MPEVKRHEVACPDDRCTGVLRVPDDLPAGEHHCICHARRLALTWEATGAGGRRPKLSCSRQQGRQAC
jgi:hypothetical protein